MSNYNEACPYCGGTWVKSTEHNGYEQWKCKNCGHTIVIKSDDDRLQLYEMGQCVDMMISFVHDRRAEKMSERIREWEEWQKKFNIESYIQKYSGKLAEDPLFAMAQIARLTYGFQTYKTRNSERTTGTVKSLYKTANNYLKEHPDATKLAELIDLYETKLGKKSAIKARIICSSVGVAVVASVVGFFVGMSVYSPSVNDASSGVNINIPSSAVSIFQKFNVNLGVENQPQNSAAYIDAKNALRNEAEKFQLYDISLKNGEKVLNFDGSVTVTMPIPEGYDTGALKVYYIESDEKYEEMSSSVSVAQNTISFETTHFSLYALAERHPIVTFDSNGSSDISRQIVKRDSLALCPSEPQKQGHKFGGWMLDGQIWDFAKDTVKKDITLVAKWIPNSYTLTFDYNGGSGAEESMSVTFMSPYGSLPTPVKSGYTFMGWYTALEHGQQIASGTIVNQACDHTVYAIFSVNTNKIVFAPNGADGSMDDFLLNSGVTARLPHVSYTRPGYVFAGWSTTLTGDVVYSDRAEYTMGTASVYTLYAQWNICSGVVKFNANGGEGTMESLTLNYAQIKILPANTFTRMGYEFDGWSLTPNGSVVYENTAQYSMGEKSEYTLYAQWKKAVNMLYFDANGGVGSMNHLEMTYDSIQSLPYNEFTRDGYDFIGWGIESVGEVMYRDGVEYKMGEQAEYTLYAQWEAKENRFTFYGNGGQGAMPTDFTIATGSSANLPANLFSYDGYAFNGWSTEAGGLIKYADEAEFSKTAYGDVNLYAQWKPITYKITFNVDGGSEIADKEYTIESDYIALPTPTKNGYNFCGWFSTSDFSGYATTEVHTGSHGDKSFYAKWEAVEYRIEFQTKCEIWIDNKTYTIETPTFDLPRPTRDGYNFLGWYESEDCSGDAVEGIELGTYGEKKYYAAWSPITYYLTFDVDGGYALEDIPFTCEDDITLPTTSKAGYAFAGWYENSNLIDGAINYIAQGTCESIHVYVKWEICEYTIMYVGEGEYTMPTGTKYSYDTVSEVTLKAPIRTGYSFKGWYDNEGLTGDVVTVIPKGSVDNKTFYPKWEIIGYTVKLFDSDGVSLLGEIPFNIESDDIELTKPIKDSYKFEAWYKSSTLTGATASTVYSGTHENIQLYAKWNVIPYNITYVGYGEYSMPLNTEFTYNVETATLTLKTPTKTGYEFLGWYDNEELEGEAVEKIEKGSFGHKYFYPAWEAIVYEITFVSNGGNEVEKITYTVEDSTIDLPEIADMSKEHYTFAGWYKTSSLNSGDYVYSVRGSDCKDYTLYAKWTPVNYTITYDYRDNGNYSTKQTKDYNVESAFDLMIPERDGREFLGWYDNKNFTGEKIEAITAGTHGNKTFYACWREVTYTIKFNSNGGSDVADKDYQITTPTFALPIPTKEHYEFAGWYANEGFGGDARWSISVGAFGDMTLYAKWTPRNYTITFEENGAQSIDIINYNIETETFKLPTAVKNGYEFLGWYENIDFSGTKTEYVYKGTNGVKTYHAKWDMENPITYTIILYPANGESPQIEYYTIESTTFTLDKPTKLGYTFNGWYNESDTKISVITKGNYYTDMELTAKWTVKNYEIVYHVNGGDTLTNDVYTVEEEKVLKNPTRTGYVFRGWYEKEDFSGIAVEKVTLGNTEKKDFYAKWEQIFTVTYSLDESEVLFTPTISDNSKQVTSDITTLDVPSCSYYVFNGWYTEAGGGTQVTDADGLLLTNIESNVILYAGWKQQYADYTYVATLDDLKLIPTNLSGKYMILMDIDADSYEWTALGTKDAPFTGEIDGRNHIISELSGNALVAYNKGIIKNITVKDSIMTECIKDGNNCYVGIIAAYNFADGVIDNCKVIDCNRDVAATINAIHMNFGGICGYNVGTINNCNVSGSKLYGSGDGTGSYDSVYIYLGSIVGQNDITGSVTNSKAYSNNIHACLSHRIYDKWGSSSNTITWANFRIGGVIGCTNKDTNVENCESISNTFDKTSHSQYTHQTANSDGYCAHVYQTGNGDGGCCWNKNNIKIADVIGYNLIT